MSKQQTAVEFLIKAFQGAYGEKVINVISVQVEQAKEMYKEQIILLVEQLKDYTKEAQCILGNDEREASEFVDIFYKETFKPE